MNILVSFENEHRIHVVLGFEAKLVHEAYNLVLPRTLSTCQTIPHRHPVVRIF